MRTNKFYLLFLSLILALASPGLAYAQNVTVKGQVWDDALGEPRIYKSRNFVKNGNSPDIDAAIKQSTRVEIL